MVISDIFQVLSCRLFSCVLFFSFPAKQLNSTIIICADFEDVAPE